MALQQNRSIQQPSMIDAITQYNDVTGSSLQHSFHPNTDRNNQRMYVRLSVNSSEGRTLSDLEEPGTKLAVNETIPVWLLEYYEHQTEIMLPASTSSLDNNIISLYE